MKTGILMTLLLIGTLAPMTTAVAEPVDTVLALASCVGVGPDGQYDRVGHAWVAVDVLYQKGSHYCN